MGEWWQEMRIFHYVFTDPKSSVLPGIENTLDLSLSGVFVQQRANRAGQLVQVFKKVCTTGELFYWSDAVYTLLSTFVPQRACEVPQVIHHFLF